MASAASSAESQPQRPNVNPLWRHSNPDSHYGFRQQPPSGSYRGRYHLPSSQTNPSDLSHYSAIPSGKLLIFSSVQRIQKKVKRILENSWRGFTNAGKILERLKSVSK